MKTPEDAPVAFQAAWNDHDMAALGRLFDQDATFVNRFGHYVRGIDRIVTLHAPIHETIYRDSTLTNALIDVVAIVDGRTAPGGHAIPRGHGATRRGASGRSKTCR